MLSSSVMSDCSPVDCTPPDSLVHGSRILEYISIPSPRHLLDVGIEPTTLVCPELAGRFFTPEPPGKPIYPISEVKSLSRVRLSATPWTVAYQDP